MKAIGVLVLSAVFWTGAAWCGFDTAVLFDGEDDWVDCGRGRSLDIHAGNAPGLTVEAWVRLSTGANQMILSRYAWAVGGYLFFINHGQVYLLCITPAFQMMGASEATRMPADDRWTHVAAQIDGRCGMGAIYINGRRVWTGAGLRLPASADLRAIIGSVSTWGMIDELRVSRTARYGRTFTPQRRFVKVDRHTVGLWHCDDQDRLRLADASRFANHGVLYNGATFCTPDGTPLPTPVAVYTRSDFGAFEWLRRPDGQAPAPMTAAPPPVPLRPVRSRIPPTPYGINSWDDAPEVGALTAALGTSCYRLTVDWEIIESTQGVYTWDSLDNGLAYAYRSSATVSLLFMNSPQWSRRVPRHLLSYPPTTYARFVDVTLRRVEARHPGIVEAVEVENEHPTGAWDDAVPVTHGTEERDPSLYTAAILRETYRTVKAFDPTIKVVYHGIWGGAYHHLDELYQLGCREFFDAHNLHYYNEDYGGPADPALKNFWHFATTIAYLRHIARDNGDPGKPLWLTEFGWRESNQDRRIVYTTHVYDVCRNTGFVERAFIYAGYGDGYPTHYDRIALVLGDRHNAEPRFLVRSPLYDALVRYAAQHPTWEMRGGVPEVVRPARLQDLQPVFPAGRIGAPGEVSARGDVPADVGSIAEIVVWVRIEPASGGACMALPWITEETVHGEHRRWSPPNYFGIVDTSRYPDGWRRVRYPYVPGADVVRWTPGFTVEGTGSVQLRDLRIVPLDLAREFAR